MNYLDSNRLNGLFKGRAISKLILVMFLSIASPLLAKDIDLATAVNLMTQHNPSLKMFDFKQQALAGASYTASLKPVLEVGLEAENFSGSKAYNGFSQGEYTVSLSSVIELGGIRNARINLVSAQSQLNEAQRQIKSLDLISQLTRSFIATLATQQRIELAQESVQLANDTYESVKQRAVAGVISDAEVKRSFAALKQAQLDHQSEQQKLASQKVSLSLYWAEKQPRFSSVSGSLFNFGEIQDIEQLFADVEQSSLLKVLTTKQQLAESQLRLAQTQSKSNVSWSIGVRRIEETNDTAMTAGFSVPLFKSKRNSGSLIEAQANIDQTVSEQQMQLLELYRQVHEIYTLRKLAVERFNTLQNEIVPALSSALDLTQSAYQEGRYGYLEYTAARQELIQSKKSLIDTAENILIYSVEIEQITAEPIYIEKQSIYGGAS